MLQTYLGASNSTRKMPKTSYPLLPYAATGPGSCEFCLILFFSKALKMQL
ncbi:unnamed protein product [Cylicostephanus goldi]|uniref:Uncharacterized protein n=1 Tax=Cylicostephanus goldi TaxID=71465 RepID=A0A3P6RVR6_CYLGO|nr:unnamed protein product [Cylicostephanus goldi]